MCNRYEYEGTFYSIAGEYQATPIGSLDNTGEVLPRGLAPSLLLTGDDERELHPMQFALCPPGCPTPSDPKRTLNNARVESLGGWPWKTAAETTRCIVPLTSFREPCYWGKTEGTEVYFERPDKELLHVAAIYRKWQGDTESLYTMSMILAPALPYVMDHGHHRSPLFIEPDGIDGWLTPQPVTVPEAVAYLREFREYPELTHRHSRNMAESWTSRQSKALKKRDDELSGIKAAKSVAGF